MRRIWAAALVIARRDFVATVWSKSFLLFLLAPIVALSFGALIGQVTGRADVEAGRPVVAVTFAAPEDRRAVAAAHRRLADALGPFGLPQLRMLRPDGDPRAQAARLLAREDSRISAVLAGTLAAPLLVAPPRASEEVRRELTLLLDQARRSAALQGAGIRVEAPPLATIAATSSAGSTSMARHGLARGGQTLIFVLTLLLAGMLLSNLVEEKSNKVIEVLAAAVPLDAVFLGKLLAMLGASVVGILVWGALAGAGLLYLQQAVSVVVTPAVGWPLYALLVAIYFTANYMLLGAVFLGIGGQASNVREVQTLSMPITFAQVIIFALASAVVGDDGGALTWIAAMFPLSSPLTMNALAAQSPPLWWHALALIWQACWVALIIRLSARLFRRTVLKSGSTEGLFAFLKPRRT